MLVDDNKRFKDSLIAYFAKSTEVTIVEHANSKSDFLKKVTRATIDIILMDVKMETKKAGISAIKILQEKKLNPTKAIFLTSEYQLLDIREAIQMNCSFIDKSCTAPRIIEVIQRVFYQGYLIVEVLNPGHDE